MLARDGEVMVSVVGVALGWQYTDTQNQQNY
jgi:hypothetical protein